MKVQHSIVNNNKLNTVPVVNGQIVYVKDTHDLYFDVNNTRTKATDIIFVDTMQDRGAIQSPLSNKVYCVLETNCFYKYVNNSWVLLGGDVTKSYVDTQDDATLTDAQNYADTNFLKKNNTTEFTPTANYHPATKKYVDDNCIPYQPFPAGLDTSHTTLNFITSIRALNLPAGSTYLGGVTLTDMPFSGNAEVEIYVYPNNVIYLTLRSANISPYMWECNSHTFRGWEAIDKTAKDYVNTNFLKKDNMTAYTPTGDYNPATKQYIDVRYERLKSTFPTTTGTGQTITLNKTAELEFVKPPLPMGNSEQVTSILPEGYTQLDYIESTGTQYIDTGYIPVQGDNIKIKDFNFNDNTDGVIFSAGTGDVQSIFLLTPSQSKSYFKWFSSGSAPIIPYDTFSKATIEVIDGTFYLNGEEILQIEYSGEVNTTLNLFRRANETSYIKASFSEFIITNNNATKKHYIACRRNSDNAIGLFDIVNNEFVGNSGTGSFTGGSDTVLPNLDYPQEITNVTGDVEEVIQNKNLLPAITDNTVEGIALTQNADGSFIINGTASAGGYKRYSFGKTITFPAGNYTIYFENSAIGSNGEISYDIVDIHKDIRFNKAITTTGKHIFYHTINEDLTCTSFNTWVSNGVSVNNAQIYMMIISGTHDEEDILKYVKHKEQVFTFPLGNEKLMLGDYLADDGKHHVRGQRIFDGTESWYAYTDKNTQSYYCYYTNAPSDCIAAQEEANLVKCNVLPESTWDDIYGKRHDTPIIALRDNKRFYVRVPFATVEEWKAYISQQYQNETSVTIEYKLDEEQTVAYTSAQQTVYNAIKQALSYEGQTNISSNQNAIFDVEAYLDTKIISTDYVKKTDYAKGDVGGLIKTGNGFSATSNGYLTTSSYTYPEYITKANAIFIGKGTLETIISSSILKTGSTAPTTSTVGYRIGQLYLNTTNNSVYQLTAIDDTDPNAIVYTWQQLVTASYLTTALNNFTPSSTDTTFDNTGTDMSSTNVEDAIIELNNKIGSLNTLIEEINGE